MKKASTYYLLLLTAANALLTWFFLGFTDMMSHQWQDDLRGVPLPAVTKLFLQAPWWPAAFAVVFLIAAIVSLASNRRNELLLHLLIVALMIEVFVLFLATVGYTIPYVKLPLSPLR